MDLRTALILIGLVVLVVVFITSYQRSRLGRIRTREAVLRRRQDDVTSEPMLADYRELDRESERPDESSTVLAAGPEPPVDGDGIVEEPLELEPQSAARLAQGEPPRRDIGAELADVEAVAVQPLNEEPSPEFDANGAGTGRPIDFIARIPGEELCDRDEVLGIYRQNEYLIDKPHHIYGLSHPARLWRDLDTEPESGRYSDVVLTVQLADRTGPIGESELTKFSMLVLRLSESLGRPFRFSMSFEEAQAEGRDLDEFCKNYDVLAILNLVTPQAEMAGTDIDAAARACGLELGEMKIYHKDGGGEDRRHLFSLANLYDPGCFETDDMARFSTKGLTLFVNMPCTRDPSEAFQEMAAAARELAERLGATLVDQNQQELSEGGLDNIHRQVVQLARSMEEEGVVPGSEAAKRLF